MQPFSFHAKKKMSGKGNRSSASSADFSRRDFRAMIYCDYCQGKSCQECFQSLKHCFGDQSPSKATVFRWCRQFMSGARTLEDDDRCGRMATTITQENISRIESLIKTDSKMTHTELQDIMKISSGSLTCILHYSLGVRKRFARWVAHNLSEERKRGRVDWCTYMLRKFDRGRSPNVWDIVTGGETWVYQYDPETKQRSAVWVFPDENLGHVATISLESRKTVMADWYVNHCLPRVRHGVNASPNACPWSIAPS